MGRQAGRRKLFTAPPKTPAEHILAVARNYLHLPDPGAFYVLLGSVAANMIEGVPVWLMLCGPPSCGGSELLNTLLDIPGMVEAGLIDSTAAFLSGTAKKDQAKDATGGLLRQIGASGGIIMKDFTSILSLQRDQLRKILGAMREMYDGRWSRSIGTDGGRVLHWYGRAAMFAKVTNVIDQLHEASAALGERWIFYRFDDTDAYEKSRRALINSSTPGWRQDLRDLVSAFFMGMDLSFKSRNDSWPMTAAEQMRIISMGEVASRCRSAVLRDPYTKEILGVRETEGGTRITTELGQLWQGMRIIGVPEKLCWQLTGKVALDSMPKLRRVIVDSAIAKSGVDAGHICGVTGVSKGVVRRTIEDLEVHGVIESMDIGGKTYAFVTKWMEREMQKGWR